MRKINETSEDENLIETFHQKVLENSKKKTVFRNFSLDRVKLIRKLMRNHAESCLEIIKFLNEKKHTENLDQSMCLTSSSVSDFPPLI